MNTKFVRFAVDTGGTFTDLVMEAEDGSTELHKSPTTPDDPVRGVLDALSKAADTHQTNVEGLLQHGQVFIHGTTRSINAILTGETAKTALLVSAGHRDILLNREGGRPEPFAHLEYPQPYIPRALTFGVQERIDVNGNVLVALDEASVRNVLQELSTQGVEAVAVCLLWSIINPAHEKRIGELIEEMLPGIPYTLSSDLNPIFREYRRASSASIDASLKPLMTTYLDSLESRLRAAGYLGRILMLSSSGGMLDAADMAKKPIHSLNSGPSMAPVAGREYAQRDADSTTVVVADTGGTSFDVTVVRAGEIPSTRETWLGQPYLGHMTGFSSVDVKSISAGGGSIAWVDPHGMLNLGPQSAGAMPGPVSFGRGGTQPTVTDASLVLGYLDPEFYLGGSIRLDKEAAVSAIREQIASPLGLTVERASFAIIQLLTEKMVSSVEDATLKQGVDPRSSVLVAGGGGSGLNIYQVGLRVGAQKVLIPETSATLSAAGALLSEILNDELLTEVSRLSLFDEVRVAEILAELRGRSSNFSEGLSVEGRTRYELSFEGRYVGQMWDIEARLPLDFLEFAKPGEVVRSAFDETHRRLFAFDDRESDIEITAWRLKTFVQLRDQGTKGGEEPAGGTGQKGARSVWVDDTFAEVPVYALHDLPHDVSISGPAIIESPLTTLVVDGQNVFTRNVHGAVSISTGQNEGTDIS